jgi:CTP:molybdopterin cytidylyltransferase MocA
MTLAILLAAGRGSRLGTPKAALTLGGRTALERCVAALRAGGAGEVRAVVAAGDAAALAAAGRSVASVVFNRDPSRGQTSSLQAGLAAGPPPREPWLLHTVDHPLLLAEDVAALLAALSPPHAIAVPVVAGRRGHPVLCTPPLAAEFMALRDGQPAHDVVRSDPSRVLLVERSNPWLVADLDTPEDLALLLAELARREA